MQAGAQSGDIFAEFQTSMGSFTCRLEHVLAPKTVANFIGLATGERPWIEMTNGRVKTEPFYDGLTFHRVVTNFVIQSGSRNGNGTDGPGYVFHDEFNSKLKHDRGVLSMANSGTPHANGSQFFITVTNASWLDNHHSVFGKVVGGMDVVDAINAVPTGDNDKPREPVVLQKVTIRRSGAATDFNIHAQGLPVPTNELFTLSVSGTNLWFTFTDRPNVVNKMFSSSNLVNWEAQDFQFDNTGLTNRVVARTNSANSAFYQLAQIQYTLTAPESMRGRELVLNFGSEGKVTVKFDDAGTGTYRYSLGPGGTVSGYDYGTAVYAGTLWPIVFTGNLRPMYLALYFDTASAGTFNGQTLTAAGYVAVSGTFTLGAPQ
jgi:peptidyl-prolyl cis-trans isomerase A (cyclophilin A)